MAQYNLYRRQDIQAVGTAVSIAKSPYTDGAWSNPTTHLIISFYKWHSNLLRDRFQNPYVANTLLNNHHILLAKILSIHIFSLFQIQTLRAFSLNEENQMPHNENYIHNFVHHITSLVSSPNPDGYCNRKLKLQNPELQLLVSLRHIKRGSIHEVPFLFHGVRNVPEDDTHKSLLL